MEDVEEGEVGELLPEDEEGGVGHVEELGDVEEPGHDEGVDCLGVLGVVHWLARQADAAIRQLANWLKSGKSTTSPQDYGSD